MPQRNDLSRSLVARQATDGMRPRGSGSQRTLCWREMDSNHRSLSRRSRFLLRKANWGEPKKFMGYRQFESISLQQRVRLSRASAFEGRQSRLLRGCASERVHVRDPKGLPEAIRGVRHVFGDRPGAQHDLDRVYGPIRGSRRTAAVLQRLGDQFHRAMRKARR